MDTSKVLTAAGMMVGWTVVARGFTRQLWTATIGGFVIAAGALNAITWAGDGGDPSLGLLAQVGTAGVLLLASGAVAVAKKRRASGRPGPTAGEVRTPVARFWVGDVSTLRAVLNLMALLLALFLLAGAGLTVPMHRAPRVVAGAVAAAWLLAGAGACWWIKGAWRAGGRDVARGWRRVPGWALRALVIVVTAAALMVGLTDGAPQIRDYTALAAGPSERSRYAIRVLRGGRELELAGELGFGVGEDLEAVLASTSRVRVLHLDSPGGRVFEGQRIAGIVARRGLTTYVAHRCESACVHAFAAGAERLVSTGAIFGLHQATGAGMTGGARDRSSRQEVEFLVARGVDRGFAERGYRTPPEDIWHPARAEVLAAKLATREARPGEVALSGLSADELAKLDLALREDPMLEALYEFERPLFVRVVSALRDGYERGLSEDEALPFLAEAFESILGRALTRTSDRAALRFFQTFAEVGRAVERLGPEHCVAFLDRGHGGVVRSVTGSRGLPVMESLALVIRDAHNEPCAVPAREEVGPMVLTVYERAGARHPGDLEADLDDAAERERPAAHCDAVLTVAEEIGKLGRVEAGPVVRYLVAEAREER